MYTYHHWLAHCSQFGINSTPFSLLHTLQLIWNWERKKYENLLPVTSLSELSTALCVPPTLPCLRLLLTSPHSYTHDSSSVSTPVILC